jgi:hypothetical protein
MLRELWQQSRVQSNRRMWLIKPKEKTMAGWMAEHRKARMICPLGPCETCGALDAEVHHKNEDWTDHRPENLQRL